MGGDNGLEAVGCVGERLVPCCRNEIAVLPDKGCLQPVFAVDIIDAEPAPAAEVTFASAVVFLGSGPEDLAFAGPYGQGAPASAEGAYRVFLLEEPGACLELHRLAQQRPRGADVYALSAVVALEDFAECRLHNSGKSPSDKAEGAAAL